MADLGEPWPTVSPRLLGAEGSKGGVIKVGVEAARFQPTLHPWRMPPPIPRYVVQEGKACRHVDGWHAITNGLAAKDSPTGWAVHSFSLMGILLWHVLRRCIAECKQRLADRPRSQSRKTNPDRLRRTMTDSVPPGS